jgi:hypothetical protein
MDLRSLRSLTAGWVGCAADLRSLRSLTAG